MVGCHCGIACLITNRFIWMKKYYTCLSHFSSLFFMFPEEITVSEARIHSANWSLFSHNMAEIGVFFPSVLPKKKKRNAQVYIPATYLIFNGIILGFGCTWHQTKFHTIHSQKLRSQFCFFPASLLPPDAKIANFFLLLLPFQSTKTIFTLTSMNYSSI